MKPFDLLVNAVLAAVLAALTAAACRADAVSVAKPHVVKAVVFADLLFVPFDLKAKDVFVFPGAPPAPLPGLVVGVSASGQEVRAGHGLPVPSETKLPPQTTDLDYEDGRELPALAPADDLVLSEIRASCGDCHGAARQRGGVQLVTSSGLAAKIDWKSVVEATTSPRGEPRMPPPDSGKKKLSRTALDLIKKMSK